MLYADIDECDGLNPCEQSCNNTDGGFQCGCDEGFVLESNSFSCEGLCSLTLSAVLVHVLILAQILMSVSMLF